MQLGMNTSKKNTMENELNYLSEKIEQLNVDLSYHDIADVRHTEAISKLVDEIDLLENIFNSIKTLEKWTKWQVRIRQTSPLIMALRSKIKTEAISGKKLVSRLVRMITNENIGRPIIMLFCFFSAITSNHSK